MQKKSSKLAIGVVTAVTVGLAGQSVMADQGFAKDLASEVVGLVKEVKVAQQPVEETKELTEILAGSAAEIIEETSTSYVQATTEVVATEVNTAINVETVSEAVQEVNTPVNAEVPTTTTNVQNNTSENTISAEAVSVTVAEIPVVEIPAQPVPVVVEEAPVTQIAEVTPVVEEAVEVAQAPAEEVVEVAAQEGVVTLSANDTSTNLEGYVSTRLNVRKAPSTSADILGTLNLGDFVKGKASNGWAEFEYKGAQAYVSAEYLSPEAPLEYTDIAVATNVVEEAPEIEAPPAEEVKAPVEEVAAEPVAEPAITPEPVAEPEPVVEEPVRATTSMWVNKPVNIRDAASMDSNVIGSLSLGQKVDGSVVGQWFEYEHNGQKAYSSINFLSDAEVAVTAPTPVEEKKEAAKEVVDIIEKSGTSTIDQIVDSAWDFIGMPYIYGVANPNVGFDCSGLTSYLYKTYAGVSLNRSAAAQSSNGYRVSRDSLVAGDLIFFYNPGTTTVGHVGIYVGGGQYIHASTPETGVIVSSTSGSYYQRNFADARRILN